MNIKTIALASAFVLASTAAAFAECSDPIAPAPVNGKTATIEQMRAAQADVKAFIKASDDYQSCVLAELGAKRLEASKSKDKQPVPPDVVASYEGKVNANQQLKQKVGDEFNAAVKDYQAAHPKTN